MTPPVSRPSLRAATDAPWSADDLTLLDAGIVGEQLVARIRLALTALLFLVPLHTLLTEQHVENVVGLTVTGGALLLAVLVHALVSRGMFARWIGFATAMIDVTAVSAALATYLVLGLPHTAVNGRIVFECYFIAIAATCLRYDARLCWIAGLLAMAEYLAIVVYATARWDLNDPRYAPYSYGLFDWSTQYSRLILLFITTMMSATIVRRAMRLRQLSTVDRLTGLLNRGYFDERADEELSRARRYSHPLSVALVDADHFKLFNDTYGHAAGDIALRALAGVLRRSVRRSDIVARYGGEEFALLFPETAPHEAVEKMEAIREQVRQMALALPHLSVPVQLTMSVGVASVPDDGESLERVLYTADGRLFEAKRAGRNRVVGPGGAPPPEPDPGVLPLAPRTERASPTRGSRSAGD
jgi:diguanylate cyclase (GGDEF)-like protein